MTSMTEQNFYPFTAVVGQENIKLALILNLINPAIGGVLISGEKGTAKSTLARALSKLLPDMGFVNLPLGITEDRLTGGLSIESAVKRGIREFEKGLLYDADGSILYIDEVNLLSSHVVNVLLTVSSMGENIVEREEISFSHPCKFVLVASMNPEEGLLKPSFLDRFGLYVEARGEKNIEIRTELIRRRLEYESDTKAFLEKYEESENELRRKIIKAHETLVELRLSDAQYALCADISRKGGCAGHRCEITLAETARAISAFNGRNEVTNIDIEAAAKFVLPHRMHELPQCMSESESDAVEDEAASEKETPSENIPSSSDMSDYENDSQQAEEKPEDIGEKPALSIEAGSRLIKKLPGSGKRNKTRTSGKGGRYVKARQPHKKTNDIAFDATLRAAALYQRSREKENVAIAIRQSDIREKLREKRCGFTILFVVDASASMGAGRRMRAVKGAVMSLLDEAYQKRDRVGIIAFRDKGSEILLNITRSVDLAEKELRQLTTGGKTPLASGLMQAYQLLIAERLKDPDAQQYLVLISDGKSNVPLSSSDARADSVDAARKISRLKIQSMVLDTEKSYIEYGFAKELSEQMGSIYIKLDNISKSGILTNVKEMIKIRK